ncbi:MAG: TRAP-type C4-dicarboxylate transport system permease small subunit [Limimaricola cinnabarinus]|jgi:TRAP-type C4-dicarboxylate transport system permease small subunit|uniref:TRAP transporter small permease n=1 Tax=Limimaricola cinnabarinus TaxID=1125964 RepID=UPI0005ED222E|nr:TRAP transporter small permease [Limimaricola cinnabarinus]
MGGVLAVLGPLGRLNAALCTAGRAIGVVAIAVMVAVTLLQVVMRYVFNNALPWPDEAARFCMLWMTGLMAPTALRHGGFVAIDSLLMALPVRLSAFLSLILLSIAMLVLVMGLTIGWAEVNGLGGRFDTASLYLPTSWGLDSWYRIPRSWMMLSLVVGFAMLILVNLELMIRAFMGLIGAADRLPMVRNPVLGSAE